MRPGERILGLSVSVLGRITTLKSGVASNTGGSTSLTVTVNEPLVVLPDVSRAVLNTVVVPITNGVFDRWSQLTVAPGTLSVAPGAENSTFVQDLPAKVLAVMFAGGVIVGGWVSLTGP